MPLLRSIFWLSLAFMVIGPRIDYSNVMSDVSNNALNSGQQFLSEQTDISKCASIECIGSKVIISSSVQVVNDMAQNLSFSGADAPSLISPIPHARLMRRS